MLSATTNEQVYFFFFFFKISEWVGGTSCVACALQRVMPYAEYQTSSTTATLAHACVHALHLSFISVLNTFFTKTKNQVSVKRKRIYFSQYIIAQAKPRPIYFVFIRTYVHLVHIRTQGTSNQIQMSLSIQCTHTPQKSYKTTRGEAFAPIALSQLTVENQFIQQQQQRNAFVFHTKLFLRVFACPHFFYYFQSLPQVAIEKAKSDHR